MAVREVGDVKVADVELIPTYVATAVQEPAMWKLVPVNVISVLVELTDEKAGLEESVEYKQFVGLTQP